MSKWYRDKETLLSEIERHGSINAAVAANGANRSTVQTWVKKFDIDVANTGGASLIINDSGLSVDAFVERLTRDDIQRLTDAVGITRLGEILGIHPSKVKRRAEELGETIVYDQRSVRSPRVKELERQIAENDKHSAAYIELMEEIQEAAQVAPAAVPPPPLTVSKPSKRKGRESVDVFLHVSDVHYGLGIHAGEVLAMGHSVAVTEEVLIPRWKEKVVQALEQTAEFYDINTVWFLNGGDMCEGHGIYKGQEGHLELSWGYQVRDFSSIWATTLAQVAGAAVALGAKCAALWAVGNHGVIGGRSAGGSAVPPESTLDYMVQIQVQALLSGMKGNGGFAYFQDKPAREVYFETIAGTCILDHGDAERGGGIIGIPFVTGWRNDQRKARSRGVNHRWGFSGHVHNPAELPTGGDTARFWNGAWFGTSNLGTAKGGTSEPRQNIFVAHPVDGLRTVPVLLTPGAARDTSYVDIISMDEAA